LNTYFIKIDEENKLIGPKRVFVIGHRNPDSDSICAAIAYAYFKNTVDKKYLYIPARAGALLKETQFILDYFKVETPILITNLSSTVSDLNLKTPITAFPHHSIKDVAMIMREDNIDTVPIVDEYQRLLGVTGYKDIAKYYIDRIEWDEVTTSVSVDLKTLVQTLQARILTNPKKVKNLTGRILIAAMQKGTILHYIKPGDIAIVGDRIDIQADLIKSGCKALILSDEASVSEEIIKLAKKHGTLILSTPYSTFTISNLLPLAVPVRAAMRQDVPVVFLETPIIEVKKKVLESVYRCALVVDSERRLISIITRSDLIYPIKKKVILVDHNEKSQAVTGVEEAEILEIIDHHRLGDISTLKPIFVYNDPVGSTCTIVGELITLHNIDIPAEIAGVLLGGILSDTLILSLSTTTERDKKMAQVLAKKAGIDIETFGRELIKSQVDLNHKSPREILLQDFKENIIGEKKIGIGQILILDRQELNPLEKGIKKEMEKIRKERGYDLVVFLIANPLERKGEEIWVKGEKEIVKKAFGVKLEGDSCFIPRILSRKKDFIPQIGYSFEEI